MKHFEQPKIDVNLIQEKANAAAEKAYLQEIEKYYTDYNSPYRKMIKEELDKQDLKWPAELPTVLGELNRALSEQIDAMANNAIASTYIPMVQNALIGLPKQITLTFLLEKIIEELNPDEDEYDSFVFEYNKHERNDWLDCHLTTEDHSYDFTLHTGDKGYYQLLSLPTNKYEKGYGYDKMTIYKDDVKIEMPFRPNILADKVINLFFKMMLGKSQIEMDCEGFDEDMFPSQDHCHC